MKLTKKITAKNYSKLLEISEKSFYRWKNKNHKILIALIDKYFSEDDLIEFLETGKIKRLEKVEDFNIENEIINIKKRIDDLEKRTIND